MERFKRTGHLIALAQRLFVPETFRLEDKDAIAGRQDAELAIARSEPDRIMILIGEIRSIESARYGEKILIKHMPQRPFLMDADMARRFRSEEHTSELQSLMRISYAVFCLKQKKTMNVYKLHNKHYAT